MLTIPFNWFDVVVMLVLFAGVLRGRYRGMSGELADLLQWLMIVVVGALYYQPLGAAVARSANVPVLLPYIGAYLTLLIAIRLGFQWLKSLVQDKLVASDMFGEAEYYLGMAAGGLRFFCVILAGLALLHAKPVSADRLAAQRKMQNDNFGSVYFPTFASVQHDVFHGSITGKFIREHLSHQLIETVSPLARPNTALRRTAAVRPEGRVAVFGSKK